MVETHEAKRPLALVTAPFRGDAFELLQELCDVVYEPWIDQTPFRLSDPADLAQRVAEAGATILICEADHVAGPVFDQPLTVIASTRGEPTNVDVDAATRQGIPVLHAPGRNADGVAELTLGLLFASTRGICAADRDVRTGQTYRDGTIPYQRFRGWQLSGRTIGIVGLGAIGRALKWRAEGLGMKVIAYDPYSPDAAHSLDELLVEADVVSLHAPVTPETAGLIGAKQFALMKPGAVFINAARSALHDTDALVEALESGHLSAAGLDHFDGEFIDPAHPLAAMDQVVLTPHIGGATYDTERNHTTMIVEDINRLMQGQTPHRCCNPEVLS